MAYPNSVDVVDGMPTSFQQYNRLRKDALYYGNPEADSAPGGKMLARYVGEQLQLHLLDTNRVRIPASGSAPVGLMVGGYPLQAESNVDLPLGSRPSGAAADYFVFAVRAAGSATFTLDVNTSATETSTTRLLGRFYWDGGQIIPESVRTERTEALRGQLGLFPGLGAGGRLTLTPSMPLTTADVLSSDTVYYSAYKGNLLPLYAPGVGWVLHEFAELVIPLAGKLVKNYDIYFYWDGAQLQSELVEWASDTGRGVAQAYQDGVKVLAGEPRKRFIGTVRTDTAGATCDTLLKRYVWNQENRAPRRLERKIPVSSWTCNELAYRMANLLDCMVAVVVGDGETWLELNLSVGVKCGTGEFAMAAISDNSPNTPMAGLIGEGLGGADTSSIVGTRATAMVREYAGLGKHTYYWLEKAVRGLVVFTGTNDPDLGTSALFGSIWA